MSNPFAAGLEPLVCISTVHLSASTIDDLSNGTLNVISYSNEYGDFVYVPPADEQDELQNDIPEDLATVMKLCQEQGIVWIKFDRDGAHFGFLQDFSSEYE